MRLLPSLRSLAGLTIVVYLCAAGWFFLLAPWSRFWSGLIVPAAPPWLVPLLDHPAVRGGLSGFGVLHFAVAAGWLHAGRPGA